MELNTWAEDAGATGKYSTLEASQATRFRMDSHAEERLVVERAVLPRCGGNLMRIRSPGHVIDVVDEGSLTVMLPVRGVVDVEADGQHYQAPAGGVLCFGPGRRRTRATAPRTGRFEAFLLKMPIAAMASFGWPTGRSAHAKHESFVPTAADAAPALRHQIAFVFADLSSSLPLLHSQRASALTEALLLEQLRWLVESESGPCVAGTSAALDKVRQAEAFMRAHFAEPLKIADIASIVGLRPRSLDAAFRRVGYSTPWARLTSIRLEQARLRLLAGGDLGTVTSAALESGFTHLGRFARLYRQTYGELPSETLRRTR